jgi:ubiquinone/menaquinone biosynthesis C-methylase UbiE
MTVEILEDGKAVHVKDFYEKPQGYLTRRRYNIRIRAEAVQDLTQGLRPRRILDIGCGDGSISLPLLNGDNRLTLVDMSTAMLSVARSNIPGGLVGNVEILNENFMTVELAPQSYDLVLCIGVIAHVDSPSALIDKVTSLVRPGGNIIMESTDGHHFLNRTVQAYHRVLALLGRMPYSFTITSSADVVRMFDARHFRLRTIFRYNLPGLPVVSALYRLIPQPILYKYVRAMYGSPGNNRNSWLGAECIYRFDDASGEAEA